MAGLGQFDPEHSRSSSASPALGLTSRMGLCELFVNIFS
jgi:hypothetical protein